MGLRLRLSLLLVAAVLPFAVLLAMVQRVLLRRHVAVATGEAIASRVDAEFLARCEEDPARLQRGARRDGARGPHGGGRDRRRAERRGGRHGRIYAFDEALAAASSDAPPLPGPVARALRSGEDFAWAMVGEGARRERLLVAVRVAEAGPCAYVVALRPMEAQPLLVTLGPTVAVSAFTALLAVLAAGPLVRRVRRITSAVRRARAGEEVALPVEGHDELTELAEALVLDRSELAAKVEALRRRDEALTRFVANTSHDVMIPLTVLQNHLVALEERAGRETEDREIASRALGEAHYIGSLLQNLGAAAKLDASDRPLERVEVDLVGLVERVVARHAPIARHKGIAIDHAAPERLVILGDLTLIERALSNLVHNAIRYGVPGGHVAVVLEPLGEGFRIEVLDDGPGVPPGDLARLGERRFRSDDARSRHPTGTGLGLAIAREVAERHGFRLRFEANEPRGLRAVFEGR